MSPRGAYQRSKGYWDSFVKTLRSRGPRRCPWKENNGELDGKEGKWALSDPFAWVYLDVMYEKVRLPARSQKSTDALCLEDHRPS
jgi:hypothetical protein